MLEIDPGRMARVNKLLRQAISDILRARWGSEAVAITITGVDTSPDLYDARITYSVLTDDKAQAVDFFRRHKGDINKFLGREVTLKRTPRLHFVYDPSLKDAAAVEKIIIETQSQAARPSALPTMKKATRAAANKNISKDTTDKTQAPDKKVKKEKKAQRSTEKEGDDE